MSRARSQPMGRLGLASAAGNGKLPRDLISQSEKVTRPLGNVLRY